jgi:glutamyl-tRNA reductase
MQIGVIGINFKSSDLDLREEVALACRSFSLPIPHILLSTCNRTEIYFTSDDLAKTHTHILELLKGKIVSDFEQRLYSFFGGDCFYHLALVTAGLDSSILAESEIQNQVKVAYEQASLARDLPHSLHYLFQKCLKIGKQIRTLYPIRRGIPTLESVLLELATVVFKNIAQISILFIGNSEINRKIIGYFHSKARCAMTLSTRGIYSASELKSKYQLNITDWNILPRWKEFDLVIAGTNRCGHLISEETNFEIDDMKNQLIVDLSVPRNINPALSKHPQINLINIDQLGYVVDKRRRSQIRDVEKCKETIDNEVNKQIHFFEKRGNFQTCFGGRIG